MTQELLEAARGGATSEFQKTCMLLAYWFPPSSESGGLRPHRLYRYLPRFGYQTEVVTAVESGNNMEMDGVFRTPIIRPTRGLALADRITTAVQRLLPYNETLEWLPYAVIGASKKIRSQSVRTIISTSPPVCTHLAALWLKLRFGIKWVADFRDPLYGSPFRTRKWASFYDAWLESIIVRNADAVVAVTDVTADDFKRRYPKHAHKIHLIWNGFDPEDGLGPLPLPARTYRTISHVGSIYGGRHPGIVLASLLRLIRRGTIDPHSVRVQLTGTIDKEAFSLDASPVPDLLKFNCLEMNNQHVAKPEAARLTAESDYLLLLDGNAQNLTYAVPAKLYEYVRVGRPVLAVTGRNSPVERILEGSGIQFVSIYPDDSADQIDNKLEMFLNFTSEPCPMSHWFRAKFDGEQQANDLIAILEKI